jgi:hypothetical protein
MTNEYLKAKNIPYIDFYWDNLTRRVSSCILKDQKDCNGEKIDDHQYNLVSAFLNHIYDDNIYDFNFSLLQHKDMCFLYEFSMKYVDSKKVKEIKINSYLTINKLQDFFIQCVKTIKEINKDTALFLQMLEKHKAVKVFSHFYMKYNEYNPEEHLLWKPDYDLFSSFFMIHDNIGYGDDISRTEIVIKLYRQWVKSDTDDTNDKNYDNFVRELVQNFIKKYMNNGLKLINDCVYHSEVLKHLVNETYRHFYDFYFQSAYKLLECKGKEIVRDSYGPMFKGLLIYWVKQDKNGFYIFEKYRYTILQVVNSKIIRLSELLKFNDDCEPLTDIEISRLTELCKIFDINVLASEALESNLYCICNLEKSDKKVKLDNSTFLKNLKIYEQLIGILIQFTKEKSGSDCLKTLINKSENDNYFEIIKMLCDSGKYFLNQKYEININNHKTISYILEYKGLKTITI